MKPTCWICGGNADSGEHSAKRSDLLNWVGKATQAHPLTHRRGLEIKLLNSVDNDLVKWGRKICRPCNNSLTQSYDNAWMAVSNFLKEKEKLNSSPNVVDGRDIFGSCSKREMEYLNLYFVKYIGCAINDTDARNSSDGITEVPRKFEILKFLSEYIKNKISCPYLYLSVWNEPDRNSRSVEVYDMKCVYEETSVSPAYFSIKYGVGSYVVDILLSLYEGGVPRFFGFWNPRDGDLIKIHNHFPRRQ